VRDARIAVVGATGAVGSVTMRILRERGFERVRAFASSRSAGSALGDGTIVEEATPEALAAGDLDIALFSVGTEASRELVPHAVRGGAVAIDKSSAYRLEPGIPLVVPEVNGDRIAEHEGILANPNISIATARNGRKDSPCSLAPTASLPPQSPPVHYLRPVALCSPPRPFPTPAAITRRTLTRSPTVQANPLGNFRRRVPTMFPTTSAG